MFFKLLGFAGAISGLTASVLGNTLLMTVLFLILVAFDSYKIAKALEEKK